MFAVKPGEIAAIAVMVVLVVGLAAGILFWYKKRKFETELMAVSWKVAYADIVFTRDVRVTNRIVEFAEGMESWWDLHVEFAEGMESQ